MKHSRIVKAVFVSGTLAAGGALGGIAGAAAAPSSSTSTATTATQSSGEPGPGGAQVPPHGAGAPCPHMGGMGSRGAPGGSGAPGSVYEGGGAIDPASTQ
jgi:hypothetical protein